jgi:1-deoxy-D-xylulose-5-phosphate reductoisomerase
MRLAREALRAGGTVPAVLNAANEVAVGAFLAGQLPFMGIPAVVEAAVAREAAMGHTLAVMEDALAADERGRAWATERVAKYASGGAGSP